MVKADGSVLVHADAGGYKPLNWMTPPTVIEEAHGLIVVRKLKGDDRLEIRARRGDLRRRRTDMDERRARLEKDGVEAPSAGAARRRARRGAARASGSCGASGRRTSGRST